MYRRVCSSRGVSGGTSWCHAEGGVYCVCEVVNKYRYEKSDDSLDDSDSENEINYDVVLFLILVILVLILCVCSLCMSQIMIGSCFSEKLDTENKMEEPKVVQK
eukprot:UN32995